MSPYHAPVAHMQFLLEHVFHLPEQWQQLAELSDYDLDNSLAVIEQAAAIASKSIAPLLPISDQIGARFDNGKVNLPAEHIQAYKQIAADGWLAMGGEAEFGGQPMPKSLAVLVDEMFNSGDCALTLYLALSRGCALTLAHHADNATKAVTLPKLYSGEWAGAMCLTEPQAGSDLSTLTTKAIPHADGSYHLFGNKIFISGGEQDLTENILYLVLARLPDAPAGSKGISLFLASKYHYDDAGNLGERNKVFTTAIEKKMGLNGSATCSMQFDGATAYLIGQSNRGLQAMFTMMNDERLAIALQGIGISERSYQHAANYARERIQGKRAHRDGGNSKGVSILQHADVRRMLLTQRAWNEGGRALAMYTGLQHDFAHHAATAEIRQQASQRLALLIPVCKAFFTDRGLESCILGQQILGGYGYLQDYLQEQLVRDVRISQIYEGTNGIQAQDFLIRKVLPDGGKALRDFIVEMEQEIIPMSACFAKEEDAAMQACSTLRELTLWLVKQCARDDDLAGSAACAYLDCAGMTIYAWLWLKMMNAAEHDVKIVSVGRFYIQHLLPKIEGLAKRIRAGADCVMDLPDEYF